MTWVKPELVCQVKLRQLDAGRPPARAGLPGPARRCMRRGGRARRRATEEAIARTSANCSRRVAKEATLTDRRPRAQVHQSEKALLSGRRLTKRDVLNYYDARGGPDPAAPEGPAALAQALPQRNQGGVLLSEGHAGDVSPTGCARSSSIRRTSRSRSATCSPEDRASLLYLVNLGCIDHNPWMSRSGHLDNPDFILIDLDPQECRYDMIVEAALMVKTDLDRSDWRAIRRPPAATACTSTFRSSRSIATKRRGSSRS